jgi:hypothetical protein
MSDDRSTGAPGTSMVSGAPPMPQRGSFAASEVLPLIQQAADQMREAGSEWRRLREEADRKRAHAKRVRANLLVTLRVFGKSDTGGVPITTAVERGEWADADADVQLAELDADLAQTTQMTAREAYNDAQRQFDMLRSLLAIERQDNAAERAQ